MIVQSMKWMMEELVQSLHEIGDLVLVLAIIRILIPPLREERKRFRERKERTYGLLMTNRIGRDRIRIELFYCML